MKIEIEESWREVLNQEFEQPYFKSLWNFVNEAYSSKVVYPPQENIFNAFHLTPFKNVKVVILGQDPYHGPNQANGLSFSVKEGVVLPPSLRNIYKELADDLDVYNSLSGDLSHWAKQGVLLLNAILTVEQKMPGAHQKQGWEQFTDRVIEVLSEERESIVFILWGSYAQKKGKHIDRTKHFVIETVHPSPLSVYRGFFGSKPFSKTNDFLISKKQKPIDWYIPQNQKELLF